MKGIPRPAAWLFLAALLVPWLAFANAAPPDPRQELKKQFAAFFAQVDESSLDAFGAVKESPETLKALAERIDAMSDDEVARLREAVGEFPTPGAITQMFPPEARETMQKLAAEAATRAPESEQMRDDVLTMTLVLKRLPDSKLRELGIDRATVEAVETGFAKMSLPQTTALRDRFDANGDWQRQSAAALETLPAPARRAAAALARHGAITTEEARSLERFRAELISLLRRIDVLPPELSGRIRTESLGLRTADVEAATPDVLFMIRHEVTPEKVRQLDETVARLEQLARLAPPRMPEVEQLRAELAAAWAALPPEFPNADQAALNLAALDVKELALLQQGAKGSAEMMVATPAIYRTLSAPGFAERVAALQQPTPDPAAVQALEAFRAEALRYIAAAEVEPELAESARQVVESAPLAKLDFLRALNENLPVETSVRTRLTVVANALECGFWLLGVYWDFNFLCVPMAMGFEILSTTIDGMIDAAIALILDPIGSLKALVESFWEFVTDTYESISQMVQVIYTITSALATAAATEVAKAFQAFLALPVPGENFTFQDLLDSAVGYGIQAPIEMMYELDEGWWHPIMASPVPYMACPPEGTPTPYGTVGSRGAAQNAERVRYLIESLIDLVPGTELSLLAKYRLHATASGFRSLAVCVTQAWEDAAAAEEAAAEAARAAAILAASDANRDLLATQLTLSFDSLSGLVDTTVTNTAGLLAAINGTSSSIQAAIDDARIDLTAALNGRSDDAESLELRLQIELNLASKSALAMFQLPGAQGGYLEMARDIVNGTISAMLAAGQTVGQASKYYNEGVAAMDLGRFKEAYGKFQSAYAELTAK